YLLDKTDWKPVSNQNGWLAFLLLPVLLVSFSSIVGSFLGTHLPFQGKTLDQLSDTNNFILACLVFVFSSYGIYRLAGSWRGSHFFKYLVNLFMALLAVLTARTAYRAAFLD